MSNQYILIEKDIRPGVALIRLNRPKELNALNMGLMEELVAAMKEMDADESIRCIVVTGNDKAFAAGADIKEMAGRTPVDMDNIDQFSKWETIRKVRKPKIAAVSGFALGGGCELTMLCDMIVASDTAKFGQPEIKLGVIPGAGGTQRLTRALGKARAMELVLTGRFMDANEAYAAGLLTKVTAPELYLDEALKLAEDIAAMPPLAVRMGREAVLKASDQALDDGLLFERKNFYFLFSTEDQKEGMQAFIDKRKPEWKGR